MSMDSYVKDDSIPYETKQQFLTMPRAQGGLGMSKELAAKTLRSATGGRGPYWESLYEQGRDTAARGIAKGADVAGTGMMKAGERWSPVTGGVNLGVIPGELLHEVGRHAAGTLPPDLGEFGETVGGLGGERVGAPGIGAAIGGTAGRMAEGEDWKEAAGKSGLESLLLWKMAPGLIKTGLNRQLEKGTEKKLVNTIRDAAGNLFEVNTEDPLMAQGIKSGHLHDMSQAAPPDSSLMSRLKRIVLGVPEPSPSSELVKGYQTDIGPVARKASENYQRVRQAMRQNPFFARMRVPVPIEEGTPPMTTLRYETMSLEDAIDAQQSYRRGGYLRSGKPGGSIKAVPNAQLSRMTRDMIVRELKAQGGVSGDRMAQLYLSTSTDYGVADVLSKVISAHGASADAFAQHGVIADRAVHPDIVNHLSNLVGEDKTQAFQDAITPDRTTIPKAGEGAGHGAAIGLPVPGLPVHARTHLGIPFGGPGVPLQFRPPLMRAAQIAPPVASQMITNYIKGKPPYDQPDQ